MVNNVFTYSPVGRRRLTRSDVRARLNGVTIDDLQGRILAVRQQINSGVESASYGDKRTEFRSLQELMQILGDLEDQLAELLGLGGRPSQVQMTSPWDKGL